MVPAIIIASMTMLINLTISDFKTRRVYLWQLLLLSALLFALSVSDHGLVISLRNMAVNCAMLTCFAIVFHLYLRTKNKNIESRSYVGNGDIIFIISICPVFGIRDFLWATVILCTVCLIWWYIASGFASRIKTIPLVGIGAILLALYMLIKTVEWI